MGECKICPRNCKVDRSMQAGYCGMTDQLKAARAALHFWEEPCFSGDSGSGTVFFSGCPMHCVFCQNQSIANGQAGKPLTVERLAEIFLELQSQGANNINLVTAGHFAPAVAAAIRRAKRIGLTLPVIYNSSGYESVETLKMLEGLVDIYLPDFKYWDSDTAKRYSNAPDYPNVARAAIAEMVRQVGVPVFALERKEMELDRACEDENVLDAGRSWEGFSEEDFLGESFLEEDISESHLMKQGVLVRHLILPGYIEESKAIIKYLYETYGDQIYISIMNQYTPMPDIEKKGFPELNRRVSEEEYDEVIQFAIDLGLENAFVQEGETAEESFIPSFDGCGI